MNERIGGGFFPRELTPDEQRSQDESLIKIAEMLAVKHRDQLIEIGKGNQMHYRNGREAKNGDKIISLAGYGSGPVNINAIGILYDATPGNDHCNGSIAPILGGPVVSACLCDCLHLDDLSAIIVEKGLDKRPAGK